MSSVLPYVHPQPGGEGVHTSRAHSVQAGGGGVVKVFEFGARMQRGQHHLARRTLHLWVNPRGDPAPFISDRAGPVLVKCYFDRLAITRHAFVDRVVEQLKDELMQAGRTCRTYVHGRVSADCFEPGQNQDRCGIISRVNSLVHALTRLSHDPARSIRQGKPVPAHRRP
jgi:hypothetical protein